uniref:LOB domain-containing protein n=2 Tax=Opuntia streptacantha TaxID=393608 RepID=A0A7C9ECD1_OPUST
MCKLAALFQSLLYEAAGRTVNPVSGAVGLLWTGNWHLCQAAVDTVLRGGTLRPIPEFLAGAPPSLPTTDADDASEVIFPPTTTWQTRISPVTPDFNSVESPTMRFTNSKRRRDACDHQRLSQLDLGLTPPSFPQQRPGTPSLNSTDSAATISFESSGGLVDEPKLLNLFV